MNKETLNRIRNWLFNETGNWCLCKMTDEDLLEYMKEEYLKELEWFKGEK